MVLNSPGQFRYTNNEQSQIRDFGFTITNKVPEVPIDPICAETLIQGQMLKF